MNSMKGKRVIITGPTSGIGKEIAVQLAALGAEIILACRDIKKETRPRRRSRAAPDLRNWL